MVIITIRRRHDTERRIIVNITKEFMIQEVRAARNGCLREKKDALSHLMRMRVLGMAS